jgi:hypothetical protein
VERVLTTVAVAAVAVAAAAVAAAARSWDKRTMRRAAPPWLLGNFRLNLAMVDGIGENDILCEL